MTLTALKGMNVSLQDMAQAFSAKPPPASSPVPPAQQPLRAQRPKPGRLQSPRRPSSRGLRRQSRASDLRLLLLLRLERRLRPLQAQPWSIPCSGGVR